MRAGWAGAAAGAVLLGAGCGGDDAGAAAGPRTTLTVFAAASLSTPFEEIGRVFEAEHEGVTVRFTFAGSSALVAQVEAGAPADVFAPADTVTMDRAVAAGLVSGPPADFATNTLQIAVPPGNPADVRGLADLTGDLDLVVCAPAVPCGAATQAVAEAAGLTLTPVSEEQSVTDVLGKVVTGEADVGLVYVTDVLRAGGDVEGLAFPESATVVNRYPIAPLEGSLEPGLGQEFLDLVLSEAGAAVLGEAGFGRP